MTLAASSTKTVFEALQASLEAAANFNRDDAMPPAAILWTDEKREWERLVPRLGAVLPHFLVFGSYDKTSRTGPAIWLRCVIAGKVSEIAWTPGIVPIIYMPGVSRLSLRHPEDCPNELKPVFELQYRGVFWSQSNGKDWTVTAFLQTNHGGLQLKIAKDNGAAASIRRSLERLVDVPVAELQAKSVAGELNSSYFDSLISDDPVDDLLSWLADPKGTKDRWETNRWETLCSRCKSDYGFDPARDGELTGAEKLGLQQKAVWKTAWKRFCAAPTRYAGLVELLRKAKPQSKGMLFDAELIETWPQDNEAAESKLRQALLDLAGEPVAKARQSLLELEKQHQQRRDWVWAKLNRTPLAQAMQYLATLGEVTQVQLSGATLADLVRSYTENGWRADGAVLDAVAAASHPHDRDALSAVIAHVYSPWLRDAAEHFQEKVKHEPLPGRNVLRLGDVPAGTCVFFVDALRYDVGQKLKAVVEARVGKVQQKHQFVALPSVTPTSKPAVSPVAAKISGIPPGDNFLPSTASDEKELTIDRFRKLLEEAGIQNLSAGSTGDPHGRAWTEFGNLDKTGHQEGIGLAHRIPELIENLVHRIESLLQAGWKEVRIVTDHGWLLLPNGMPKTDLPKYLTATRWRRCAVVKESAKVDLPSFPWFWCDQVRIACPPGIDCFMAGEEYHHGGLSLQECLVPQLSIQAGAQPVVSAKIESVKWAGLRCRVKVFGHFSGCKVDIRDKAADPTTSLTEAKPIGSDGSVALVVTDDSLIESSSTVVLLDASGSVIDKMPVTVGGG